MKPIDRNAFYLIPATALTVISLLRLSNSLSPVALSGLSDATNRTDFVLALILTVVALCAGVGLVFRARFAYLVSVSSVTLLLGFACYHFFLQLQRAPGMNPDVLASLVTAAVVQIVLFLAILVLLLLPATRERCFPRGSEEAGDRTPNPAAS